MQSAPECGNRRRYGQPILRRLTFEQGTLFLVGYAYVGNKGAREIMAVVFPTALESRSVPTRTRGRRGHKKVIQPELK